MINNLFKYLIFVAVFVNTNVAFNQKKYFVEDSTAKFYADLHRSSTNIKRITNDLIKNFNNEESKFRAIFRWISLSISYDLRYVFVEPNTPPPSSAIKNTLKNRVATCGAYNKLLKEMCEIANLDVTIINGLCKPNLSSIGNIRGNSHSWSSITIGGKTYLSDITWASGIFEWKDSTFKTQFDEIMFLCSPDIFIFEHFPYEKSNQFLEPKISKCNMKKLPRIESGLGNFFHLLYKPHKIKGRIKNKFKIKLINQIDNVKLMRFFNGSQVEELVPNKIIKRRKYFIYSFDIVHQESSYKFVINDSPILWFRGW